MRSMHAQHVLDRCCLLDVSSERCRALVITMMIAIITAMVASTFSLRRCT